MNKGFVYLDEAVPGSLWDAKYATANNFTGAVVDGYEARRVVGTLELAAALRRAAVLAKPYALLFWDAYRPQRAVDGFARWAQRPEDGLTKAEHYPRLDKADMIREGYVALRSAHTRGCAVDLTLALGGKPVEMGGGFDLMDEISRHDCETVSPQARANRARLKSLMESAGFAASDSEWWHYRLAEEPYPDTYFDFPIC